MRTHREVKEEFLLTATFPGPDVAAGDTAGYVIVAGLPCAFVLEHQMSVDCFVYNRRHTVCSRTVVKIDLVKETRYCAGATAPRQVDLPILCSA